jgi:hypothetical protein
MQVEVQGRTEKSQVAVQVATDECSSELSHEKDTPAVGEEILVGRKRVVVE